MVNKDLVTERAGRLGRPAEARICQARSRSPAIRAPPTRRSWRLRRRSRRRRRRRRRQPATSRSRVLQGAEQGRQLRAGHRQGRHAGAGHDADHDRPGTTTRLPASDTLHGNPPVEVVVPKSGVVAGVYVQAISAYAPHPNAAKLWMEYLYSDEGQLGWLKGYCHPIRFNDLVKRGVDPAGPARQAAAGSGLRSGRIPDARRSRRQQGSGHRRLGRGRRRQRSVTSRH